MERWQKVQIRDLTPGDSIKWWGAPATIATITPTTGDAVQVTIKYPDGNTEVADLILSNTALRLAMRKCHPCFDSDCDCIYDQILE